jgi:hypothetical protein
VNDLTRYESVRDFMRAGDVVAFGGDPFSRVGPVPYPNVSGGIEWLTGSLISHVSVVFETTLPETGSERRVILAESTSLNGRSGVQFNPASQRIGDYDGRVYLWTLADLRRHQLDADKLHAFLLAQDGLPYDFKGIAAFIFRAVPALGQIPYCHHGAPGHFFCSEYVVAGYKAAGLPLGVEADEVSPQRLGELSLWDKCVQLVGRPAEIRRFNSV